MNLHSSNVLVGQESEAGNRVIRPAARTGVSILGTRYNGLMAGRPVDRYLATLRELLPELAEKYHVRSLEVFGSYVRDEQTPESDLDVLVTFDKTPGLLRYISLENHLSDLLGIKVDLVMKSALKPRIGQNILREAVPV